eukprot:7985771-Pyramimonas_sp.AAC.1
MERQFTCLSQCICDDYRDGGGTPPRCVSSAGSRSDRSDSISTSTDPIRFGHSDDPMRPGARLAALYCPAQPV